MDLKRRDPAPEGRIYAGCRAPRAGGGASVMYSDGGAARPLSKRLDLRNHSPDGFQWGYEGSGPAQLALALLADATGEDALAIRVYQQFKRRHIGRISADEFTLCAGDLQRIAAELDAERALA